MGARWGSQHLIYDRRYLIYDRRYIKNITSSGMSYWSRPGVVSLEAFDVTTVANDAYSFHSSYKIPKRKHIPDPVMEHIPDPVMEQSSIATNCNITGTA